MVQQVHVTFDQELKKNPELKVADIKNLREWCDKQPHLPEMMDHELALFLHSNYYHIESTKVNIETYYTIRTQVPEFFSSRDSISNQELRQAFDIILDELLHHEGTIKGYIFLIDMINSTVGHAGRMSPMSANKILTYLQDGVPLRLKGLHFINTNTVMDIIMSIIKPFMKKDLLEMLHLHANLESLEKHVPLEIIPNELGGKAGSLLDLHKEHVKNLEEIRHWFLQVESRARIDESKRLEKKKVPVKFSGDYGFDGSFKKIGFRLSDVLHLK